MSASRCRWRPRRPTYPTLRTDLKKNSRSTVKFQFHAEGFLNSRLCDVTVRGRRFVPEPPGLSGLPNETLAVGWNGGLPPRKMESLTARRVKNCPPPARTTVFGVTCHAIPSLG